MGDAYPLSRSIWRSSLLYILYFRFGSRRIPLGLGHGGSAGIEGRSRSGFQEVVGHNPVRDLGPQLGILLPGKYLAKRSPDRRWCLTKVTSRVLHLADVHPVSGGQKIIGEKLHRQIHHFARACTLETSDALGVG